MAGDVGLLCVCCLLQKCKPKTGDSGLLGQWYNWVHMQPALLSKVLEHVMHPESIIADLATTFVTTLYGEHLLHMDTQCHSV